MTLTIDSRLEEVRRAATAVHGVCGAIGVNPDEAYRIETAVVEALNNAIVHSYGSQPGHRIGLLITLVRSELVVEVSDSGPPISRPAHDTATVEPGNWRDLSEQGRGWDIMRAWMDEVRYLRRGRLNVVRLRKRVQLSARSE